MLELWYGLLSVIEEVLRFFHGATAPLFGDQAAWGWAIILLTISVRILMIPLAVKQAHSQRALQRLQPEVKKIQDKFKVDRKLMQSNPEKYREQRVKQQEATMALYREHGVNPAASCLPLLPQLPIFFALFSVLNSPDRITELQSATFYFLSRLDLRPAGVETWGVWLLVLFMGVTQFISSRQLMASSVMTGPQAQNQKIIMYVMPVILVFFSRNIPAGVLLYWATTNLWQVGQQWFIFRRARQEPAAAPPAPSASGKSKAKKA